MLYCFQNFCIKNHIFLRSRPAFGCQPWCRRPTISVVDLQEWLVQGNSDSGSERLRLPTASLTIVLRGSSKD